jgi:hypothetical protein
VNLEKIPLLMINYKDLLIKVLDRKEVVEKNLSNPNMEKFQHAYDDIVDARQLKKKEAMNKTG